MAALDAAWSETVPGTVLTVFGSAAGTEGGREVAPFGRENAALGSAERSRTDGFKNGS